jgi:hypothetical protein
MHFALLQGNLPEQEQGQEREGSAAIIPKAEEQERQAATQGPNFHDQRD